MPRERIQHGRLSVVTVDPKTGNHVEGRPYDAENDYDNLGPNQEVHVDPSLEVAWTRDQDWVQVQLVKDGPDEFARATSDPLTRKQVNHLIKTLRRARDAAFGTDE